MSDALAKDLIAFLREAQRIMPAGVNLRMPDKRYVVDLFSGEGGASFGYFKAGFMPVGVDSEPARIHRYPYSAFMGDWRQGLDYWLNRLGDKIAFIHASPPCQYYSVASEMARARGVSVKYPDLIPPVLTALSDLHAQTGIDYVIENVPRAPLDTHTTLCGSFFGLSGAWNGELVGLKRHRKFKASWHIKTSHFEHTCWMRRNVPVYGHGAPGYREGDPYFSGKGFARLTREVMGIDWMSRRGLTEAIPPAYACLVGESWKIVRK